MQLMGPILSASDAQTASLMSHYLQNTSKTLALTAHVMSIWCEDVPSIASTVPFLWHSICAISALHLAELHASQSKIYISIAQELHLKATSIFRESTRDMLDKIPTAVLSFCILVAIFHFKGILPRAQLQDERFIEIMEPFLATRSAMNFLRVELLREAEQPHLLVMERCIRSSFIPLAVPDVEMISRLNKIEIMISSAEMTEKERSVLQNGHAIMKDSFELWGTRPITWIQIAWWPAKVADEFVGMMWKRDRFALELFACWCEFVGSAPDRWFWRGWTLGALECIRSVIL